MTIQSISHGRQNTKSQPMATRKEKAENNDLYARCTANLKIMLRSAEGRKAILEAAESLRTQQEQRQVKSRQKLLSVLKVSGSVMLTIVGMSVLLTAMNAAADFYCMGPHVVSQDPLWCIGRK